MWICCQIGAREHYAVPRTLHRTGQLSTLYTDFWAGGWGQSSKLKLESRNGMGMGALRALAGRYHPELDLKAQKLKPEILKAEGCGREEDGRLKPEAGKQKAESRKQKAEIVSWNWRALWWEIVRKAKSRKQKAESRGQKPKVGSQKSENQNQFQLSSAREMASPISQADFSVSAFSPYHGYIEVGRRFATCVRNDLKRRKNLGQDTIFFAYDTGALEAMEWCRERDIKCVLNQMDPNRVEVELVIEEERRWPGWALEAMQVPEAYFARREREWALADRVMVNSEFCRQALLQQGVAAEKLVVVPLCFDINAENLPGEVESGKPKAESTSPRPSPQGGEGALRVLFLGQVILRKGIQYLIETAKLLADENIHFDVVGAIGISREAVATAPDNMTFHGRAGRDQAADWYRRSHLFVLPTLSDGFAITQLEAMAHGLPVITTPNCGEVVSDGVDGFIVPPRDAGALARTFRRYLTAPELLSCQSAAALVKVRQFTSARLADNLRRLEEGIKK